MKSKGGVIMLRTFDNNINYKNAKLSRETPLKQKIGRGITAVFFTIAVASYIISPFIETPITGYTFDGYNLENVERNENTYNLYYNDNAHYELSLEELKKEYNQNERYCVDLDNKHKTFITPIIDKSMQNKVMCVGTLSLVISAGPMIIKTEKSKKLKRTQRR